MLVTVLGPQASQLPRLADPSAFLTCSPADKCLKGKHCSERQVQLTVLLFSIMDRCILAGLAGLCSALKLVWKSVFYLFLVEELAQHS